MGTSFPPSSYIRGLLNRYWKEGAADGGRMNIKASKIDYVKETITARGEFLQDEAGLGFYSSFTILRPAAREMKGRCERLWILIPKQNNFVDCHSLVESSRNT